MTELITFALLGLGVGATYAVAAMGIVLVHRGSGVVNFAHVGISVVGAFLCDELRRAGLPMPLAVLGALVGCAVVGLLIHLLVMQRMRRSSALSRVVATLGVLTVLESAAGLRYGDGISLVPSLLPTGAVRIAGGTIGADRLLLLGLSGCLGLGLWAVYRFTRFGRLTSAVAENPTAVAALGRSPHLVAMANWMLGAVLSGAAGILLAPIVGLSVTQLSLLLIPPLAAAVLGGFSSFALSFWGALFLGVAQSEITRYVSAPGWSTAVPILMVMVVLVARGRGLPARGSSQERLPAVGSGVPRLVLVVAVTGIAVVGVLALDARWVDAITIAAVVGLLCLSLTVLTGYAGQLSLAQFALAGCAALVSARAAAGWGLPFPLAALVAVLVTTVLGALVALPALRVRGVSLGIVTLGVAVLVEQAVLGNPDLTGGVLGTTLEPPGIGGFSLDATEYPERYALLCLAVLAVAAWAVSNLRRGQTGRLLLAMRGNERAAATLGLSITRLKFYAFAVAAMLAALAGVLLAFRLPNVTYERFGTQSSIDLLGVTVIGGLGYIGGAIVGAISTGGGPIASLIEAFTSSPHLLSLITGALMLVTLATAPNGTFALAGGQLRSLGRRLRPGRDGSEPAPAARPEPATALTAARPRRLTATDLSVAFGGTKALQHISLTLEPGEVFGVIGPNGAGKTTLIDTLTGLTRPDTGAILLDGADLTRRGPARRARVGVIRSFQSLELFDDLTVADQLLVPLGGSVRGGLFDLFRVRRPVLPATALAAIDLLGLSGLLPLLPGELSYGQRRLLAIARALAADPSVLLLDEPAAGLDERERDELAGLLRRLAVEAGIAVLLVEHDVALVGRASDRVMAMDFGAEVITGTPEQVLAHPAVAAAYLGTADPGDAALAQAVGQ